MEGGRGGGLQSVWLMCFYCNDTSYVRYTPVARNSRRSVAY